MNEYKGNDLEEFAHPYELDYSSLKSSKNESLKIQHNIKDNNNLLGINSNNNNNNNFIGINNNNFYQNNPNTIKIQNNDNFTQNNNINNNINYNNNYRLNENNKRNMENIIVNNNNTNKVKINDNKIKSKSKSKPKKNKNNKHTNNTQNNIHVFSTANDYWEKRGIKNKEKMNKIKKEREKKLYGEIYPIPKINKNTQEIIERIKERTYDNIPIEDQVEDEINKDIPKKTKQRNNLFKNSFYITQNNSNKVNKSTSKIKVKNSYDNLMKIKINNKKRPKTPNPKKSVSLSKKKIKKNKKIDKLHAADIKNLEMIMKLRKEEEEEKMRRLEERIKIENNYIEEKIKEEDEENSPEKIKEEKNVNNDNMNNIDSKIENYLNKSMNLISFRSKSTKDNQNININEIMTSRKYLNDLYNKDKKIINHSFIQSSSSNKSVPKFSNQRNIEVFYKNKSKNNNNKISPKLNKSFTNTNTYNFSLNNFNKDIQNLSLYDPKTKSLRYKHYTEEGGVYNYNNASINNNNNISQNYNINYNNNKYDGMSAPDEVNKNVVYFNPPQRQIYNNINNKNYSNNNKNMNNMYIDEDIQEKNNEIDSLYKKEYNFRNNEINKLANELQENSILNQQLLNEAKKLNNDNNDYEKIILQNESINNIFNELDNESLLKYREENNQKLYELNQKKITKKSNLPLFLQEQYEESKDVLSQIDKDVYRKINSQKYKNILMGQQQKIENSLDYYNKELKINEKKKEMLLNKMFGDNYAKNRKEINYDKDSEINFIDNDNTYNNNYGVDKYLVKNKDINIMRNNNRNNENNKYKFVYSPYKMVNGIKKEVKKDDIFNDDDNIEDILGSFDFKRRHHFS